MGNKGIYSVDKEFGKANKLFARQKASQDGPSRETLANFTTWHDSLTSNHVLHLWPFRELLLASYSQASHAQIPLIHLLKLNFSPISHTYPLQINPHTYKKND